MIQEFCSLVFHTKVPRDETIANLELKKISDFQQFLMMKTLSNKPPVYKTVRTMRI